MLRRKPMGKYHVQVCTNVACMLRGGTTFSSKPKSASKSATRKPPDGVFSLEEVECIGACTGAPAMQVNYDFYENLTVLKFDRILEDFDKGRKPAPEPVISGALHDRHPLETPLISARWGIKDSRKIDVYLKNGGYKALEKALKQMTPETDHRRGKEVQPPRTWWRRFPNRPEMVVCPERFSESNYLICNADESEPGTCKDRPLMEMDPHQLIEGMVIAGRAIGANRGFIYIRGEYRYVLDLVEQALVEAYGRGYLGKNILDSGFDYDFADSHGRGRLRVRRRIRLDGIAGRQTR